MRTSKIFRRTRKLIVVASFGLLLFGAINKLKTQITYNQITKVKSIVQSPHS